MVDHLHDFHAHTFSNLPSVDSHALNLLPDQAPFDWSSMAHGEWPGDGQHLWDAQHSAVPGGLPSHGHELSGVTAADHHCTETPSTPHWHGEYRPTGSPHQGHPEVGQRFGSYSTRDHESPHGTVYRSHDNGWSWNKIN